MPRLYRRLRRCADDRAISGDWAGPDDVGDQAPRGHPPQPRAPRPPDDGIGVARRARPARAGPRPPPWGCPGALPLPVRLVAVPEGALQGFNDEVLDVDHETFARECAIDIPGPESDELGRLAGKWGVFVMAQAKARHPEFPGRFFNVGFVLDPDGQVVLRHHKVVPLLPVEHSVTPHNVFDRWIELYGATLDAFYPVADTEIGRLGIMMANEGSYPENARGLAVNGAEVVYRASFPHRSSDAFVVQTRARALDNNLYVIAPNVGTYYLTAEDDTPIDTFGGHSLIVDHVGRVVGDHAYSGGCSSAAGAKHLAR